MLKQLYCKHPDNAINIEGITAFCAIICTTSRMALLSVIPIFDRVNVKHILSFTILFKCIIIDENNGEDDENETLDISAREGVRNFTERRHFPL